MGVDSPSNVVFEPFACHCFARKNAGSLFHLQQVEPSAARHACSVEVPALGVPSRTTVGRVVGITFTHHEPKIDFFPGTAVENKS